MRSLFLLAFFVWLPPLLLPGFNTFASLISTDLTLPGCQVILTKYFAVYADCGPASAAAFGHFTPCSTAGMYI